MKFKEINLKGAFIVEIEKLEDDRGFFARSWDSKKFEEHGLNPNLVQCNISFNKKKGTLRGLHFQKKPYEEAKLVRCTKGIIFDVIVDLRPNSDTFNQYFSIKLSERDYKMLYVPEGFAHGFQTLEDNTEVFYQMTQRYVPEYSSGMMWNNKIFDITWPIVPPIISKKDSEWEKSSG